MAQALESDLGFALVALGTDAGPENLGERFLGGTLMRASLSKALSLTIGLVGNTGPSEFSVLCAHVVDVCMWTFDYYGLSRQ